MNGKIIAGIIGFLVFLGAISLFAGINPDQPNSPKPNVQPPALVAEIKKPEEKHVAQMVPDAPPPPIQLEYSDKLYWRTQNKPDYKDSTIFTFMDSETGCQYIEVEIGRSVSIIPRLNSEGQPYCDSGKN